MSVTDPFLNFILTLLTLLSYFWSIGLSCLALCHLHVRFRPQLQAFRVWTTQHFHQLRNRVTRHFTHLASQGEVDSAAERQSEVVEL